jgi:sugar phosphate isomerase/epimerase
MKDIQINILHKYIGLGSFAFRYAIGVKGFQPPNPMDTFAFIQRAYQLGYRRVQLCENLNIATLSKNDLRRLRDMSKDMGMVLEIGLRKVDEKNLSRHIELALLLEASFIRAVSHDRDNLSQEEQKTVIVSVTKLLKQWAPRFNDYGVTFGLENHFDITTKDLVKIVTEVASANVGLVFDTTNSLGFLEPPEDTLKIMREFILSVHLKDYIIQKGEAGYEILGTILGEGFLNIPTIFSLLGDRLFHIPIILESTARRNFQDTQEKVMQWEESIIQKNTIVIDNLLRRYHNKNAEEKRV